MTDTSSTAIANITMDHFPPRPLNRPHRINVNLKIEPWLNDFIVISSIVNLTLAALTFAF